jgi:hypothetical protein
MSSTSSAATAGCVPLHIRERIRSLGPTVGDFAATI